MSQSNGVGGPFVGRRNLNVYSAGFGMLDVAVLSMALEAWMWGSSGWGLEERMEGP